MRTDSVHGKRVRLNLKVSLCRGRACSWLLTSSIMQMCNIPPTKFHRSSLKNSLVSAMNLTVNENVPADAFLFCILQNYIVRKLYIHIFYGPKVSAANVIPASYVHIYANADC